MMTGKTWRWAGVAVAGVLLSAAVWAQQESKGSKEGTETKDAPAAKLEIGKPAPAFELKGTDGKTYKLSDYSDKIVVLEWINKDCPVCKAQQGLMKSTSEALAKKGVVWLAIDSTHNRKVEDNVEHVKNEKLIYPILDDRDGKVGMAYGARSTPTMYVINKGTLAYMGAAKPQKEERNYISEVCEALVAGKAPPVTETPAYGCSVKYARK